MKHRSRTHGVGSLDLLLDTITNTFGGVLFLAVLVVMLLRQTAAMPEVDTTPKPDPIELVRRLDTLRAECNTLRADVATANVADKLNNPELAQMLHELNLKRDTRDQLRQRRATLLQSLAEAHTKSNVIASELQKLDRGLQSATQALADVERNLRREKNSRKMISHFPQERRATKSGFSVIVKYNRLYEQRTRGRFGIAGEPNLDDFFVHGREGGYLVLSPKPYRGVPIATDGQISSSAATTFAHVRPASHYISIAVWDDSYSGFQVLREYLVKNDYEYRLVIVTEGDEVVEGHVVDPKVQ